ncbi:MAG: glutamine-hydrolyzing carbamoyl-phosphate synthase small subunit [Planctomycetota bacterium]
MNSRVELQDGTVCFGESFGATRPVAGEVVFNTGMVGYPESLTDPSYRGQILVFTYPLVGNYGVPSGRLSRLESDEVQVAGVIVAQFSRFHRHADADASLQGWLRDADVPAISGIDTRFLTRHLRAHGSMLGKILPDDRDVAWSNPNDLNLLSEVSIKEPVESGSGAKTVLLVDFGCKRSIETSLLRRGFRVKRVPWNCCISNEAADAVLLSNGPGDPRHYSGVIEQVALELAGDRPVLGVCLGHQLMALASGCEVFKLPYGHRGQNQPCREVGTRRYFITSQNHGYAVDLATIDGVWLPWFENGNDGTCEGLRHSQKPHMSVQFHPEARPGPNDTAFVFDRFLELIHAK